MKRVLLVDDEPETLELLKMRLANAPFHATFCETGIEAIYQIFKAFRRRWCYDVLVLDCAMPHFDAFTIAKIVRLAEKTDIVPGCRSKIAVFTAFPETVEQSTLVAESGIDKYWRKPHDIVELGRYIAEWLKEDE